MLENAELPSVYEYLKKYNYNSYFDKKFDIEYSNLFNDIFPILLCSGISAKSFVVNNEIKTNIFLQGYNLNYLTNAGLKNNQSIVVCYIQ